MLTTVFMNNRTQSVRLPSGYRFSEDTQKVFVRMIGVERVISPVNQVWDSFFDNPELRLPADFERGEQVASEREAF